MNNSYIWWEQWLFELHEELWLFKRNRVYPSLTTWSKAVSMQVPTVQGLTSEMGENIATYESPEEVLAQNIILNCSSRTLYKG